jgi:hypothetical protein
VKAFLLWTGLLLAAIAQQAAQRPVHAGTQPDIHAERVEQGLAKAKTLP